MTAAEALEQSQARQKELEEQRAERKERARQLHEDLKAKYRANLKFARQQADTKIQFAIGKGDTSAHIYCGVNEDGAAWSEVLHEALVRDGYVGEIITSNPDRRERQRRYRVYVKWGA